MGPHTKQSGTQLLGPCSSTPVLRQASLAPGDGAVGQAGAGAAGAGAPGGSGVWQAARAAVAIARGWSTEVARAAPPTGPGRLHVQYIGAVHIRTNLTILGSDCTEILYEMAGLQAILSSNS